MQGNNPTYDAFCYQDQVGIAWQHMTAHDHPFSNKGFGDLNKRFKAACVKRKWFIFVVPTGTTFKYPTLPKRRSSWDFFVLELDVSSQSMF